MFKLKQGFTLVELLVVIAIIGILSSVAVVNLNSAREKAKIAAIQQTLASLRPVVLLCFSNEENLQCGDVGDPCSDSPAAPEPGGSYGGYVCGNVGTLWPDIETQYPDWGYCFADSDAAAGTYSFGVIASGGVAATCSGATAIICTESTCSVSS